jgi:membrane protease YdiL (CAAX protease family)
VLLVTWGIVPFLPRQRGIMAIPLLLAVALMIGSHHLHGEGLTEIGLTFRHFGRALGLTLLPGVISMAIFVSIGQRGLAQHHLEKLPAELILLPLSGIVQQYLLQGFIYRRIRFMLTGGVAEGRTDRIWMSILLTASIFSLIHAPNLMLMFLTLTGGIIWSWIYERAPNIFVIGTSHGLASLMVIYTLPPTMLKSLGVGYKYFLYNKFQ